MGELVFLQWCTGIMVVSTVLWIIALGVFLFHEPRYRRGNR